MEAYLNNAALKEHVLAQLALHRQADKLVKGTYWEHEKGCAVGCTLESVRLFNGGTRVINHGAHQLYESELGIPRILAQLEDKIFESLDNGDSQAWPERFASAICPGADLTMIWPRFALWLLTEELPQRVTLHPDCRAALDAVAALYLEWVSSGTSPDQSRWLRASAVANAAYAADATAVDVEAVNAADAAATAAVATAAAYAAPAEAVNAAAAYAAATAAAYAIAEAAEDASTAAGGAAEAACSAGVTAVRFFWVRSSDKLIELLAAA